MSRLSAAVGILHESGFPKEFGGSVGGAGKVANRQAIGLAQAGTEVNFINRGPVKYAPHGLTAIDFTEWVSIPHDASQQEIYSTLKEDDNFLEKLRRALTVPGAVYSHSWVANRLFAEVADTNNLTIMGHSWDLAVAQMDPTRKISADRVEAERYVLDNAANVIVATNAEKQLLVEQYGHKNPANIHIVPLGVEQCFYELSKQSKDQKMKAQLDLLGLEPNPNNLVFTMLARISEQKRQLESIQGFSKVAQENTNIHLAVAGGPLQGSYYDEIRSCVARLPQQVQERIKFLGVQDPLTCLSAANVLLFPSAWETFGLAMAEAMAAGRGVITSDIPILREVSGEKATYINSSCPHSICDAIYQHATRPDLVRDQGQELHSYAAGRYTWENSVNQLTQILFKKQEA